MRRSSADSPERSTTGLRVHRASCCPCSGHLDLYLLFLLALIVFALKFNRARFQKSMDLVIRRFMGDSDEGTVAMTDTCYEFRSGDNVMRVVWRNLGSYYVFSSRSAQVKKR